MFDVYVECDVCVLYMLNMVFVMSKWTVMFAWGCNVCVVSMPNVMIV